MAFAPPFSASVSRRTSNFLGAAVTPPSYAQHRRLAPTVAAPTRRRASFSVPSAQLVGMPEGFGQGDSMPVDEKEVILAEMRFSDPTRLPTIIQNNLDILDDEFYTFIESKINASADMEERDTLRALRDAITDVMKQLLEAAAAQEAAAADAGAAAPAAGGAASGAASAPKASVSSDVAQATYDELIDTMARAHADDADGTGLRVSVDMNYERIDMRLLERLTERIGAAGADVGALGAVRDTISAVMNERVAAATEALRDVLSAGDVAAMRKKVDTLARQGRVDDAFILLVQANMEQAKQAGVQQAVDALGGVLQHAASTKEVMLEPEVRLIRQLLRTDDEEARLAILLESFKPRQSVTLVDGSASSGVKVDGKKFVTALRGLIQDFGNIDQKFVLKLSKIGEESEAVARKLYDMEGKDVSDLQEEAFHKRSVSIWDLEKFEMDEQMEGRDAPWEGRLGEIPEKMGFGEDGKMAV